MELRLSSTMMERVERLSRLTGWTRSVVVSRLIMLIRPATPGPEEVVVPITAEAVVGGIEVAMMRQWAWDGVLTALVQVGRSECIRAHPESDLIRMWRTYWNGDPFPSTEATLWRGPRKADREEQARQRLHVAFESAAMEALSAWQKRTQKPSPALVRMALDELQAPFAWQTLRLDPEAPNDLIRAATSHGLSPLGEAALWLWAGAYLQGTDIAVALGRDGKTEASRAMMHQRALVLQSMPLSLVWRGVCRYVLAHPADMWLFAEAMWQATRGELSHIIEMLNGRVAAHDGLFAPHTLAYETWNVIRYGRRVRPDEPPPIDRLIAEQLASLQAIEQDLQSAD